MNRLLRRSRFGSNVNYKGDVLRMPLRLKIGEFDYHWLMGQMLYHGRFAPLRGRFTKLKDGSIVCMFQEPAGTMVQYPDGTKRFISEEWYQRLHDEPTDWSDEMAKHLTVVYADKDYMIFRREIRISGAVIPLDGVMDLETIPFPDLLR